jgi:hypothetical protein
MADIVFEVSFFVSFSGLENGGFYLGKVFLKKTFL